MGFWAAAGVRHPWLRMTDGAESVAVWVPPSEPELTAAEESEFAALITGLFGERAPALHALFERFGTFRARAEPHYYLDLWATDRRYSGRGLGTALLRDNLARIDAESMPAYLESTNPANVARYEALGFDRIDEFLAPHGPAVTTMWRAAR